MPEFEGKINCIYIDPPYNTGNEGWVYNDNVNDPKIKKWLGQVVGKEGEDLSRHDKWLCMMYPRLKLLHRLLSDDGAIFVSIDSNEQANLKLVMDEIFGGANFISTVSCINNPKGRSDDKYVAMAHESILIYRKSSKLLMGGFEATEKITKRYKKVESNGAVYREIDLRKTGDSDTRESRPNMYYPFFFNKKTLNLSVGRLGDLLHEDCIVIFPMKSATIEGRWRWGAETAEENISNLYAKYMPTKKQWSVFEKDFFVADRSIKPTSVWDFKDVNSERGTETFFNLGFVKSDFPNPKPVGTIERVLKLATKKGSLILDSFAGSGTTAQAVLNLNAQDGGSRRFICVEMMDYAETITAERVRRVMNGYGEGSKAVKGLGGGFHYYTVGEPLFLEDRNLNEAVGECAIRKYVAYTENIPSQQQTDKNNPVSPYTLGVSDLALWVFYYQPEQVTTLDMDFLASLAINTLQNRPENYVIYADKCTLENSFMTQHGIVFKRIPRDITKF